MGPTGIITVLMPLISSVSNCALSTEKKFNLFDTNVWHTSILNVMIISLAVFCWNFYHFGLWFLMHLRIFSDKESTIQRMGKWCYNIKISSIETFHQPQPQIRSFEGVLTEEFFKRNCLQLLQALKIDIFCPSLVLVYIVIDGFLLSYVWNRFKVSQVCSEIVS